MQQVMEAVVEDWNWGHSSEISMHLYIEEDPLVGESVVADINHLLHSFCFVLAGKLCMGLEGGG